MPPSGPLATLPERIRSGDRMALSQAITLVESDRALDRASTIALMAGLAKDADVQALRIGITGIPGVGKSTFIDALGMAMIAQGHRVAVLAIDPSSTRSGGSILGDKTRMPRLSASDQAFIRPTATGGHLGGIAQRTREAIRLCEVAGHDRVLIETVGIGQNELAVDRVADLTVLLTLPGTGDELQGIKRGIMESADLVILNKADRADRVAMRQAEGDLRHAVHLLPRREGREPQVLTCSSTTGEGIGQVLRVLDALDLERRKSGDAATKRSDQAVAHLREALVASLLADLRNDPACISALEEAEADVAAGRIDPEQAAANILDLFRRGGAPPP